MAIQQDIVLNFKSNIDQAKNDVTTLASLYQQSLVPQGQPGALDASQQGQVQDLIAQRAADTGMSQEQVKQVLQEVVNLEQQHIALQKEGEEIDQRKVVLADRIQEATEKKNAALNEARNILGLEADASQEVIRAKLKELQTSQTLGISEKERNQKIARLRELLKEAGTQSGRITKSQRESADLASKQIDLQGRLDGLYSQIRAELTKIVKTDEERDAIEKNLMPLLMQQQAILTQNTREREKSTKAAKEEEQVTKDINNTLAKVPGTFAQKAVGALLYYEALNQLKRIARAAINTLRDLDKALTDIAVVTSMNREES